MISVIIVVYNTSKYLKYALDSVLNQSYKDYEIIAVDDGSTDGTVDILNEYTSLSNFLLIQKEHSKNLGGNRNHAIKLAKGEIIAFIDGDDIWNRNKLMEQLGWIDSYDMVCSNASLINENNDNIPGMYNNSFKKDSEIELSDLLLSNYVIGSSVLIKKQAIELGGYFEDGPDTRAEDYVLWLNYLKHNKIKFLSKPLLKYRIHSENWSNSKTEDWIRLLHRTIKIRSEFFEHPSIKVRKSAKKGSALLYLELAKTSYKERNVIEAKNHIKNLLKLYNPKFSLKYIKYIVRYIYFFVLSLTKRLENH